LQFEVGWVVVFAEEDAHFFAEYVGLFLEEEIDVAESDVLDFGL
jgi:hypothetical protein